MPLGYVELLDITWNKIKEGITYLISYLFNDMRQY